MEQGEVNGKSRLTIVERGGGGKSQSMHKIAIFYHGIFRGTVRPIDPIFSTALMAEQMAALEACGLADFANEIWIGINGPEEDGDLARMLAPTKAKVIAHGEGTGTEITTMNIIREWVKSHSGWYVLYFHMKSASHPENPNTRWRLNMEQHVLANWRGCVLELDRGYDACGCYWLTPEEHPTMIQNHPFFGGTFFWTKSDYLATLPPLPEPEFVNRYAAESWIGSGPRRPRVKCFIDGWPPQS